MFGVALGWFADLRWGAYLDMILLEVDDKEYGGYLEGVDEESCTGREVYKAERLRIGTEESLNLARISD